MNISEIFVRRPIATSLLMAAIALFGIVAYRVGHGSLPPAWSHIPDVGPSYVVVSAIVVAVMFGTWLTRVTVLAVFAVLVFISHIFAGLTSLHVAAVGHLTAIITAAVLGFALAAKKHDAEARSSGKAPDSST